MDNEIKIIKGGRYVDDRGGLDYMNDFDMGEVKRMYLIHCSDVTAKRGWRGHKLEQRWFYAVKGCFQLGLIRINDFNNPDPDLAVSTYLLSESNPCVVHMPVGCASIFKALELDSRLLVYSDSYIEDAGKDDYQFEANYFNNWK